MIITYYFSLKKFNFLFVTMNKSWKEKLWKKAKEKSSQKGVLAVLFSACCCCSSRV